MLFSFLYPSCSLFLTPSHPFFPPSALFSLIAHTDSVISGPWCALRHIITTQCGSHLYGTKEQDGAISFSIVTKVNCCRGYSQWFRWCKTDTSADLVQTIWWLLQQTMVWGLMKTIWPCPGYQLLMQWSRTQERRAPEVCECLQGEGRSAKGATSRRSLLWIVYDLWSLIKVLLECIMVSSLMHKFRYS